MRLALLSVFLALPIWAQQATPLSGTNTTASGSVPILTVPCPATDEYGVKIPAGTVCFSPVQVPQQPAATGVPAQAAGSVAAAPVCPTFYAAGAAYSPSGSPKTTGWVARSSVAPGVKCDPTKAQPQWFSQYVVVPTKTNGVWTFTSVASTGLAYPFTTLSLGKFSVECWLIGNMGPAVNGATSTVSLGSAIGGMCTESVFKGTVHFAPAIEWVDQKPTVLFAIIF